jgi:DNA-binding SARP family transcriptional activator
VTLRLYLLGGFHAEIDSQPLRIPKVNGLVELWAYLALHPRRPIPRDQLAFLLWPDEPEEAARGQLRRCLFQLARLQAEDRSAQDWLRIDGRTVQWNQGADTWLDAAVFLEGGDELSAQSAALDLYRGDLLPEISSEWAVGERSRLRAAYLAALERQVQGCLAQGDTPLGLKAATHLAQADPCSETGLRYLIQLRYMDGDRAGALRSLEEYKSRLATQGLEYNPAPETGALIEAIMAGRAVDGAAVKPEQPEASRKTSEIERILGWLSKFLPGANIAAITASAALGVAWLIHASAPLKTLTIRGPQAIQDTWILSYYPDGVSAGADDGPWLLADLHDGRGWVNPRLPFARYPTARVNLANRTVEDALLRFDLSALPPEAWVESAKLRVVFEPDANGRSGELPRATISAYRLLRDWDAGTATFSSPWSTPGLAPGSDYNPRALDRETLSGAGALTFDLTRAVQAWQRDENEGVILMASEAPQGNVPYWLLTSDHPDASGRPQLTVRYR